MIVTSDVGWSLHKIYAMNSVDTILEEKKKTIHNSLVKLFNSIFLVQIRIHWPVEKCRLLGEEVVIIDSPGIDVDVNLDDWIDR